MSSSEWTKCATLGKIQQPKQKQKNNSVIQLCTHSLSFPLCCTRGKSELLRQLDLCYIPPCSWRHFLLYLFCSFSALPVLFWNHLPVVYLADSFLPLCVFCLCGCLCPALITFTCSLWPVAFLVYLVFVFPSLSFSWWSCLGLLVPLASVSAFFLAFCVPLLWRPFLLCFWTLPLPVVDCKFF